jgi:hypothetical protein
MKSWAPFLIVIAGLAAYCGSFTGPFVYDDLGSIPENPSIRHVWPLWGALTPPRGDGRTVEGRPVLNLSLALNYAISGTQVWSYHAANILIHLLAGLALYGIVRRTLVRAGARPAAGRRRWRRLCESGSVLPALSVALIWTVHPLQTEAVTYVIQRAESLMGLCYLLTLYGFVRYAEGGKPAWAWFSLASCLLGMGTKEVAVTLPVMVLVFDRTFFAGTFGEAWRRRGRYYLGLAATWVPLAILIAVSGGNRSGSTGAAAGLAWGDYVLTQFEAVGRYLGLSVWPHPLVFDYGFFLSGAAHAAPYALLIGALAAGTLWALVQSPPLGFCGFWFFGILAVTSLVPGASEMIVERRMYLPLAAVVTLVVLGGYAWAGRRAFALSVLASAALGWVTWERNLDYRSELRIWETSLELYPHNARAHRSLGFLLAQQGKLAAAQAEYREAWRIDPNSSDTQNDLGTADFQLGDLAGSIARYREALRLAPGNATRTSIWATRCWDWGGSPKPWRSSRKRSGFARTTSRLAPIWRRPSCNPGAGRRRPTNSAPSSPSIRFRPRPISTWPTS